MSIPPTTLASTPWEKREPVLATLLRRTIKGNYFYVFSAILMMLGSYLLMQAEPTGDALAWTLRALLILQAYEILVIATAIVIVRRLGILSDAFTLLLVELALLLDPTCFADSFYTLRIPEGGLVNLVCLLLVPIKLAILCGFLGIRPSLRALAAYFSVAAFVYLVSRPLAPVEFSHWRRDYVYAMAWAPLLIALILPSVKQMLMPAHANSLLSTRQESGLHLYLYALLLLVPAVHVTSALVVYDVPLRPMYLSPLLLALALLHTRNSGAGETWERRLGTVDALGGLGLVCALNWVNPGYERTVMLGWVPPMVHASLALTALYLYYYVRFQHRPALYRVAGLVALALIFAFFRLGLAAKTGHVAAAGGHHGWEFLAAHPAWVFGVMLAVMLALAFRVAHSSTWLIAGAGTIFYLFRFVVPIPAAQLIPEIVQLSLVLLMVLYHRFGDVRGNRHQAAGLIALIALGRLLWAGPWTWWGLAIAGEAAALGVFAWWIAERPHRAIAGLFVAAVVAYYALALARMATLPTAVLILGLLLFAAGVVVTFTKTRLLARLAPTTSEAPVPEEQEEE